VIRYPRTLGESVNGYSNRLPEEPRLASSAIITRYVNEDVEMLMGLRHPEVPTFPEFWAFPGGGVSPQDRKFAGTRFFGAGREDGASIVALFRELTEETGFALDTSGEWMVVDDFIRKRVCTDDTAWSRGIDEGIFTIDEGLASLVTERTTPPLAPVRYTNRFYHIPFGKTSIEPKHPPGRSEFTQFKWWAPGELLSEWQCGRARMAPPQVTFVRDIVEKRLDGKGILSALSNMSKIPPMGRHKIEFAPGVECLPIPTATLPPATHTNCFIIGRGKKVLIVDPAVQNEEGFEILKRRLSEIHGEGKSVMGALYTHKHPDHIGDQSMINVLLDGPILASPETIEEIGSGTEIADGQVIDLSDGYPWTVIETPGHCPGMVSLVSEMGILSADNVTMVGTILIPSQDGSMIRYLGSLERLRALKPKLLFPSHGPVCASPDRLLGRTINHRKQRHERILKVIQSGIHSLAEITLEAYQDSPNAPVALSRDQALSHINGLIEQRLVVESDDGYHALSK
tara:strand:- start:197 stop:1735 length:1539 start_codon:yes stop_codon:yes gene_type:complete